MAYTVPEFNLLCNVYQGAFLTRVLRIADLPCNLAWSRRVQVPSVYGDFDEFSAIMSLLLPAGSDVRDLSCAATTDIVECPSGSGRWYLVGSVDDIGKGFLNEHRCALIYKVSSAMYPSSGFGTMLWPAPIP